MYQVSLKSEGGRPFFVITWPGITLYSSLEICHKFASIFYLADDQMT